jgi:hypothetical protein
LIAQSTGSQNGIYIFNGSGSALTRAEDADEDAEVTSGMLFLDENRSELYTLATAAPIIVGTTALSFEAIVLPANPEVLKNVTGASYTLLVSDPNKWLDINRSGVCTVTVPANNSARIPVNSVIWGRCAHASGTLTFAAGSGAVNIRAPQGLSLSTQHGVFRLKKIATNEWSLIFMGVPPSTNYDPVGTAAALLAVHTGTPDPHPQYKGITIAADAAVIATAVQLLELVGADFVMSVNSDGSVNLGLKNVVRTNAAGNLTAGYKTKAYDNGTKNTGTFTPDPVNGNIQKAINGGAHTLAPPSITGDVDSCSIVVQYTNNGSAGAITTSGFTKVDGSFDTTSGNDFLCTITVVGSFSHLNITALQ